MGDPVLVRLALRLIGLGIGILIGWQTGAILALASDPKDVRAQLLVVTLAVGGIGYVLGPHLTWAALRNVREWSRRASAVDLVAVGLGIVFGALVAALLAVPLSALPAPLGSVLPVLVAVATCVIAVMVLLLRKRDLIAPWVPIRVGSGTTVEPREETTAAGVLTARPPWLLDSSVAIDGRIVELARTGFLESPLLVPSFVLEELQAIADSADPTRRSRGRRGLETLDRLRRERPDAIAVSAIDVPEVREVDAKLVRLALARGLRLLTNDHNLGRVADLQGVSCST